MAALSNTGVVVLMASTRLVTRIKIGTTQAAFDPFWLLMKEQSTRANLL